MSKVTALVLGLAALVLLAAALALIVGLVVRGAETVWRRILLRRWLRP